ncbi:C-type lectin domain family 4 member E-like isoform X1 [Magallana gigas]|uniref:C-type lectin domain family 4 member E-like isoform X1 n=1 Tax=Magallana gigas TaxID=29159 RepID=UPI00334084F3
MSYVRSLIWFWLIYQCAVTSLVYQHTVYQRRLNPTYDNGTTPIFSSTVPTFQACINKCHNQPPCDSLVFDIVTLKCSLYEGKTVEEEITINQIYHQVLNKTVHRDIIEYAQYLCSGKSPGYIYNETVPVCYKIDPGPRTLVEAVSFCGESGGHLLQIDTERKQRLVENLRLEKTESISKYRVDGKKTRGKWTFLDGTPITVFFWYPGEPADNFIDGASSIALRVGHQGKWDDINATWTHGSICEKDIKFD